MCNYQFTSIHNQNVMEAIDLFIDTFTKAPWYDVYDSRAQVENFFERFRADNYFLGYLLFENNQPIALSMGAKKPWIEGMEYVIDQFCVSPSYQNQGIGSYFLEQIEIAIQKEGIDAILLNTDKDIPAEAFYHKNGFHVLEKNLLFAKVLSKKRGCDKSD